MNVGLILAGGLGLRMNKPIPKQFIEIDDVPIILRTMDRFDQSRLIDCMVVVCVADYIDYFRTICENASFHKPLHITPGGSSRNHSIKNGLLFVRDKISKDCIVVIHNANQPMVTIRNLEDCITNLTGDADIVCSSAAVTSYMFQIGEDGGLSIGPDRDSVLFATVPEAIRVEDALSIYCNQELMREEYASYTTGLMALMAGMRVKTVSCESTNFKITTQDDFALMRELLRKEKSDNF